MQQNEKDFLEELLYCVERKDMVKAGALLQFFPELSTKYRGKVLYEILRAPDPVAFVMLERLSRVPVDDPVVKDKITELIYEKSFHNDNLIIEYIRSKKQENKALYVRIAGNLKLRDSLYLLEDILLNETDDILIEEAITAIGKIGDPSSSSAVASFLQSKNTKLKLAAIYALADMGGVSAIKKLCESLSGNSTTDLVIIETLAHLQDRQCLETLTDLLSSRFVDLRNAAIDRLIEIGPKAIPFVSQYLKSDDDDTIINCLYILGHIGDVTALPAIAKVIYKEPKNPNVRFAVYEAMERLPSAKSAISLAQGLTDPISHVSMAAAKAIDKNLSTVLVAGIRNMIEAQDELSERVVATLIDSGADNAFNFLLDSEAFQAYAVKHLTERAHPETVDHFVQLLKRKGSKRLINRINKALKPEKSSNVKIMAVDDSRMMLKIYQRKLHDFGYDVEAHEYPAKALFSVKETKPDLLITDLNMPEMNGLQLSGEIRKLYGPKELPIIMITTQSDIAGQSLSGDKGGSDNVTQKAGIDIVLNKPFEDADLKNAIQTLLNR